MTWPRKTVAVLGLLVLFPASIVAEMRLEKGPGWWIMLDGASWGHAWGSAFPTGTFTAPVAGDRFERFDLRKTYFWDGDSWEVQNDWSLSVASQGGGGGIPAGLIVMTLASCPTGFSEVSSLSGKFTLGTVAANGDVGGTGGADNITPAGTNASVTAGTPSGTNSTASFTPAGTNSAPTFSGNALATHTHTFTGNAVNAAATAASPDLVTSNTAGSGVSPTTTATGTNSSITAGTPAGTVSVPVFTGTPGTVPAQTFTGNALASHGHTFTGTQFDNRPAFVKVIFCSKN